MKNKFEIIATINTKTIDKKKMCQFIDSGVTIFRINSSFLKKTELVHAINRLRNAVGDRAKILIDLPGYKVRFLYLDKNITFKINSPFKLKKEYFNYPDFLETLNVKSIMRINNGFNVLTVLKKTNNTIICVADSNGTITKGKGIHVEDRSYRPSECILSSYDLELLDQVRGCDVNFVGLSYIHDMKDIRYVEGVLKSSKILCIPKIESKESIYNLRDILKHSKIVILDRGDLSGEIGLERIWKAQKEIISLSKSYDCKIILATQILASMINNPLPTIAEVDALYGLLDLGVGGIQFSEETSIGSHGKECIDFVTSAVKYFKQKEHTNLKRVRL